MESYSTSARAKVAEMEDAAKADTGRALSFQGAPGANSHLAALEYDDSLAPLPCFSFPEAIDAVREGRAGRSIIPIENSLHGRVADIHFLLPESGLSIVGEHFMRIRHTLMAKDADVPVTSALSHVQALGQCRHYLKDKGIAPVSHADTAGAAAWIADNGAPGEAAIAPRLSGRPVVTIASAVAGEDALYIDVIRDLLSGDTNPLIIYVPRAPERFDTVAVMLRDAGLSLARRSEMFDADLGPRQTQGDWIDNTQVLLGDSLGEMYFYLALADKVVAGGGFLTSGAHNIIEPLALEKPVVTGPYTHTIENPFVEAQQAGVAISVPDGAALAAALRGASWASPEDITAFMAANSGASLRTCAAIRATLQS